MDATFPPALRLHDGRDYGRVFNRQQKAAGRHVVVLVRARRAGSPGRLGVMVPSKAVPSSVRRHQLKRWVRELFRLRLKPTLLGCDAVVLFRCDPPPAGHALLDGEILALVPKALAASPNPDAAKLRRGGRRPARPAAAPGAAP